MSKWIFGLLLFAIACSGREGTVRPFAVARVATVDIYIAPVTLSQPNTTYILQNDVSGQISIAASSISLDLNGYTVTYSGSHGIDVLSGSDVEILNGTVYQSMSVSDSDPSLADRSPLRVGNASIHDLTVVWRSAQTNGIDAQYSNGLEVYNCTLIDEGWLVTNRNQMHGAIQNANGQGAVIRDNEIVRTRHLGIFMGDNCEIYGNTIHIDSWETNSYGIMGYGAEGFSVHHNTITGEGGHPIGIGFTSGSKNGAIYGNTISVENTTCNTGYGCGIGGHGIRTTWGSDNVEISYNDITVYADTDSYSRAMWLGAWGNDNLYVHHNFIRCISRTPGAIVTGIVIVGDWGVSHAGYRIENNVVESDYACVVISDSYGAADGYPVFKNNTFRKTGSWSGFKTIMERRWDDPQSTGLFVNNKYENGAGFEDMFFWWQQPRGSQPSYNWCNNLGSKVDIKKGWDYTLHVESEDGNLVGVGVEILDNAGQLVFSGQGSSLSTVLVEYSLTNCPQYPLPEMVTLDYLGPGAHKVEKNPYTLKLTRGAFEVVRQFDIRGTKVETVMIEKLGKEGAFLGTM